MALEIIIFFLFTSALFYPQTTIIYVQSGDSVYLGADSQNWGNNDSACKIITVNDVALAFTGYLSEAKYNFNIINTAKAIYRISSPITYRDSIFHQIAFRDYREFIDKVNFTNIKNQTLIDSGYLNFSCTAIKFDNNGVFARQHRYFAKRDINSISITDSLFVLPDQNGWIQVFGESSGFIDKFNDFYLVGRPAISIITDFITLQSLETPERVQPPIDILTITPNKFDWIQRKCYCYDKDIN